MNKNKWKFAVIIFSFNFFILLCSGCNSKDDSVQPIDTFKLDGTWQAYIFNPDYDFTSTLANLRTNGTEVKGNIISDCFGLFQAKGIPFRIIEGVFTGTDISLTFLMETTGIVGHFNGNLKSNFNVNGGKEIVGHLFFEYSGHLTQLYVLHLVKQSIDYLPKSSN